MRISNTPTGGQMADVVAFYAQNPRVVFAESGGQILAAPSTDRCVQGGSSLSV